MEYIPVRFVPQYGQWQKRGVVLETEEALLVQTHVELDFIYFFSVIRQCVRLCLYRAKPKPFAQQKGSTLAKTDGAKLIAVVLGCSSWLTQPEVLAAPISTVAPDLCKENTFQWDSSSVQDAWRA